MKFNNSVHERIINGKKFEKYLLLVVGIFLNALSFNLFFAPNNIVTAGSKGLALLSKYWWGFDPSMFVLLISLFLIIISFFALGEDYTYKTIIGTLLLPIFIKLTEFIVPYFNFGNTSMFVIAMYGGIISGFSVGLILRTGFSTGEFYILYQIMHKYLKISVGTASRVINIIIIAISAYVFGVPNALYAVVALYVSTFIMDRVVMGTSNSKVFYIVTDKENEVKEFIINNLTHSVTLIDGRGGYSNKKKKVIMCTLPTREYFWLKEVVLEIDEDAFFMIADAFEVAGGT